MHAWLPASSAWGRFTRVDGTLSPYPRMFPKV